MLSLQHSLYETTESFFLQYLLDEQDRKLYGDLAKELAESKSTTCLTKPAVYNIFFTKLCFTAFT